MKKLGLITAIMLVMVLVVSCGKTENNDKLLKAGDEFTVTGVVGYSDEPSDIGIEYCFIKGDETLEYIYLDIYEEESQWKSDVFYTIGDDTALLKEYVGEEVTVSGFFDAEAHGIPYIIDVDILR